jgi:hypothetical protein
MRLGILTRGRDRIVKNRPSRRGGEAFDEREIIFDVTGRLRDLNETLIAFAQHSREVEDVFITHQIGDHGRTVIVGLGGILAEALDRKSAEARVHSFREQSAHLVALGLRGRARFRCPSHRPSAMRSADTESR